MKNEFDPSLLDKTRTIVNFSNTILAHYGLTTFHPPLEEALSLFRGHRKIALFLFDALGEEVLRLHKKEAKGFLKRPSLSIYSSNPATTVAATTAFLTGKYPIETGYLGWSLFFDELSFPVEVFPNLNALTEESLGPKNLMEEASPIKKIDSLLNEAGIKAHLLFPSSIDPNGPKTLKETFDAASTFFHEEGEFLYCYWPEPDHSFHKEGVGSKTARRLIKEAASLLEDFAKKHPDVLPLSFADHGMIDVRVRKIDAFHALYDCLSRPISLEGRTVSFGIKPDKREEFEEKFHQAFPSFLLFNREEIIEMGYFGEGTPHPRSLSFIGDYIALPTENDILIDSSYNKGPYYLGHHAGISLAERRIAVVDWSSKQ